MVVTCKTTTIDLNEELDITGYSTGRILDLLEEYNCDYRKSKNGSDVKSITAKDISEGKGYMSRVFICTVTFEINFEYKCALKIPTLEFVQGNSERFNGNKEGVEFVDSLAPGHNRECDIIQLLSNVKGFPTATVYFVEKTNSESPSGLKDKKTLKEKTAPGMIMMSLLTGITTNFFTNPNESQLLNLSYSVAHLQNVFDRIPQKEWVHICNSNFHFINPLGSQVADYCRTLSENWPEMKDSINVICQLDQIKYSYYALRARPEKLNASTVILGDFQPNNVMWEVDRQGKAGNEVHAIYDFQMTTHGNCMFDLARYFAWGLDPKTRKQFKDKVIEAYYSKLTELQSGRGDVPKYTLDICEELFELAFVHQAYQLMIMVGLCVNNDMKGDKETVRRQKERMEERLREGIKDSAEIVERRKPELMLAEVFK